MCAAADSENRGRGHASKNIKASRSWKRQGDRFSLELPEELPRWCSGKKPTCNAGDKCSVPGAGRSPGEGNGNLLQYPCLENPMDRGDWQAAVHATEKTWT